MPLLRQATIGSVLKRGSAQVTMADSDTEEPKEKKPKGDQDVPQRPAKTAAEIARDRNKLYSSMRGQQASLKERIVAEIKAAHQALHFAATAAEKNCDVEAVELFKAPVKERVLVCEALVLVTPKVEEVKPGEDKPAVTISDRKLQDEIPQHELSGDEAAKATVLSQKHHDLVQAALNALEVMPMESKNVGTSTEWASMLIQVRSVNSQQALEEMEEKWSSRLHLANQLVQSTRTSIRELVSETKKAFNKLRKSQEASARQAEQSELAKRQMEEQIAKRTQVFAKDAAVFGMDWSEHVTVKDISPATLQDALTKPDCDNIFALPFIVQSPNSIEEALGKLEAADPKGKLVGTLNRWAESFPHNAVFRKDGVALAPVLANMGAEELAPALAELIPQTITLRGKSPNFATKTSTMYLAGYSETYVRYDFYAMFLDFLHYQAAGTQSFILFDTRLLQAALEKNGSIKAKTSQLVDLVAAVKNLGARDIKFLKDNGCMAHHCSVKTGEALFVPAGWFVAVKTTNGAMASAMLNHFFLKPSLEKSVERLRSILNAFQMHQTVRNELELLLDIAALDANQQKH